MLLAAIIATPTLVLALAASDAETMYTAFNSAFLTQSGSDAFYKTALDKADPAGTWAGSLNILGTQDAYERTGDPDKKTLINDLLTTWLANTPTPWDWDGWNDDIGWFTLALVRGHQMTGNADFLAKAIYGFELAFDRGWNATLNDGGIWEEQPEATAKENPPREATKEALSNDSLGKVACMLYQSTHDGSYLDDCKQIYAWVSSHLFNAATGQINTGVDQNGKVDTGSAAYNQGTFLDFANLLFVITGEQAFYDDAKKAIDYGRESLTVDGVFSNSAAYLNTWADEMARGVGHFVRDNGLWSTYYAWMQQNADAIVQNKRTDLGITWNAWAQTTPINDTWPSNHFVSALAWLQFTPATQPSEVGGIHSITNQKSGMAIDSAGIYGNGSDVVQWGENGGLHQRWLLTQNSDESWNIVNLGTWESMDCPQGSKEDNLPMIMWPAGRDPNQRWTFEKQDDGSYKIGNAASGMVLDGGSSTNNGAALVQAEWSGGSTQRWSLK